MRCGRRSGGGRAGRRGLALLLALAPLLLLLPGAGCSEEEEAARSTANDLYVIAKTHEGRGEALTAMRAFVAAHRLAPADKRFLANARRIAQGALGVVRVEHEGRALAMPVLMPPRVPGQAMPPPPLSAGSADDQVAAFFRWQGLPVFRDDSPKCCAFSTEKLHVMGSTCLSSLYVKAHNDVQNILLGRAPGEIPTESAVPCGKACGVVVPPPPQSLPKGFEDVRGSVRWEGEIAGKGRTVHVVLYRNDTAQTALDRAATEGLIPSSGEEWDEALKAVKERLLLSLLSERHALLASLGPYVHRSQIFGDEVMDGAGLPSFGKEVRACTIATEEGRRGRTWDVRANRVLPSEGDADAAAAQEYIRTRQSGRRCRERRALVYHHDRAYWGFAANVHFMTVALNHALSLNRTLVARNPDHWNYAGRDCRSGWECYFHAPSACSEKDLWPSYTLDVRMDYRWDHRGLLYRVDTSEEQVLYYANVDGPWQEALGNVRTPEGVVAREWIPPQFAHRGLLWWRAQLTRYLFRPKRFVLDYIGDRMDQMGLPAGGDGVVAMHVRRGDKAYDSYQGSYFGSIDSYVAKARAQMPDLHTLFVCTDDPEVIKGLNQTMSTHNVKAIFDHEERRYNGTHIYAPMGVSLALWPAFPGNDPAVNTTLYALDTIKSIWLLSLAAPAFVGTVTSSMSRLVYQLRIAFGQTPLADEWTVDQDLRHGAGWFADP